jgi:YidC/Oxa1 family membrane protein insertase
VNPFSFLFNEILWRPLFNGLVLLYAVLPVHDLGLAIVALTVIIRLAAAPLFWKGQRAQRELAQIQPEVKRIQSQFKNNREEQAKALMQLYAAHKVNPFSGCVVLLIQLPILIALFEVFRSGFDPSQLSYLYSFVPNPGTLNPTSFGILDLSKGNLYLGGVAAITQYVQTRFSLAPPASSPGERADFAKIMQWQAHYVFPALILAWSYSLPSALTLYWTVLNILGILQEILMKKFFAPPRPE